MRRTTASPAVMVLVAGSLTAPVALAAPGDFGAGGAAPGGIGGGVGSGVGGGLGGGLGGLGGLGTPLARGGNGDGAPADITNWALTAGATRSDNIGRTTDDRISDTIAQVGLQLGLTDTRPRLQTELAANLSYWEFIDHTYGSQLVGGANAGAILAIVPERFIWSAHDNWGQVGVDPTAVVTPGNTQNINLFSTGPSIELPLGGNVNSLALQGLYSKANFGTTNQDYHQYLGSVSLQHKLWLMSVASLSATDTRTYYDSSLAGTGFEVRSATVGFDAVGVRTTLSTTAGYTQLRYLGRSSDGLLAQVGLTRLIGSRSKLSLEVGTDYSDTAAQFAQGQDFQGVGGVPVGSGGALIGGPLIPGGGLTGAPGGVSDAALSSDPFKSDYATATWDLNGTRSTIGFNFTFRKETHQTQTDFNRRYGTAGVTVTRRLTPLLTVSANGVYTRQHFASTDIDLNGWSLGAAVDCTLTRTLTVQGRFDRQDGSGSGPERNYTENRFYIGISYSDGRRAR